MSKNTTVVDQRSAATVPWTAILNKAFIAVFFANLAMNSGQMLVNPLISRYVKELGGTPALIGIVSSSFALVALACKFFSGPIIDATKRKWLLWVALCVQAVAFFGYSISGSIVSMVAFRMTQGLAQAFTATIFMVVVSQAIPKERLGTGMGVFWTAQSITMAIGSALAIHLSDTYGYSPTFALGGSLVVIAVIIVTMIKIEEPERKKFKLEPSRIIAPQALIPASILGLSYLAFASINAFLIVYAEGVGIVGNVGFYSTAYALTLFISRPLTGTLKDKFGFVPVVTANLLICIAVFFLFSVANNLATLIVAGVIMGFGFGACQPVLQALAMQSVSADRRGAASSTNYIGMDLGSLFGASLAGVVASAFGYVVMWRVMTIPFFVALVLVWTFARRIRLMEARD